MRPLAALAVAALLAAGLAGCISQSEPTSNLTEPPEPVENVTTGIVDITLDGAMTFNTSVVDPAVGTYNDLYEPTIEVAPSGTIYIAGHVAVAADTTGTPAYYSTDNGDSWQQLPFAASVSAPSPVQMGSPPPGDEGFIVAGQDGHAYMVDITGATYPVTAWCGDGSRQCYHNPNAYDRVEATRATAMQECVANLANDRPWAAVANGTLLMVNNRGGGPVQIGTYSVPFDRPTSGPATWNMCASDGGFIPGVPALSQAGHFVVPQAQDGKMVAVMGNVDSLMNTTEKPVLDINGVSTVGGGTNGWATYDDAGNLFFMAATDSENESARFAIAASRDDGKTFESRTFDAGKKPIWQMWIDGNLDGPGALVTWLQDNGTGEHADYYAAHARIGPNGTPTLEHVSLVAAHVPMAAQGVHVVSSGPGASGGAYLAGYVNPGNPADYAGSTPLRAYIQTSGPTLPTGNATAG